MINQSELLKERIGLLEIQQKEEMMVLKEQIYETFENLKPLNLIKSTLQEVSTSTEIGDNILNNAIGLTTGYISKKILVGATHNPVKKMAGVLLQFAIANVVAKHSETIKAMGEVIVRRFFEPKNEAKQIVD